MTIVSISRQFGSGGRTLAEGVAKRLNLNFVDDDLVSKTAELVGIKREAIENTSSPAFKGEGFVSALVHTNLLEQSMGLQPSGHEEGKIVKIFWKLIPEFAAMGNVVFLGRGSQFILPDTNNTVKVLLVAKQEDRVKFMQEKYGLNEFEAFKAIHLGEKHRVDFLKRFTNESPNDPSLYDLAINVSMSNLFMAQEMICNYVREKAKLNNNK